MAKGEIPVFKLHAVNQCKGGDKAPGYFPSIFIIVYMEIND
jgi:hypothetical protein